MKLHIWILEVVFTENFSSESKILAFPQCDRRNEVRLTQSRNHGILLPLFFSQKFRESNFVLKNITLN